jgi:HEAT repeats
MKYDSKRRQSMAAKDLLDQLQGDRSFVARALDNERQRSLAAQSFARAAAPVVADLQRGGYQVESIDELRHSGKRYKDAVPILLNWLTRSPPDVKEDIVRTLSVPWARPAASQAMVEEFKEVPLAADPTGTGLRWVIGNALEVLADESIVEEMVKIATDPGYGVARQMVVLGLARPRNRKVTGTLISLLNDQDVAGHAAMALGRLRAADARAALEALADNGSVSWFRTEARKALRNLE